MKIQEAIDYINYSVKEGFMSEEEAERLMNLPWKQTIREVQELMDRGDAYANDQDLQGDVERERVET